MSFLTAEWRNLAIANYEIDKSILADYLPYGTELDLWNGSCYLSLVGFMFLNTKLLGIKMPYHVNFEEVNLRFYVKRLTNEYEVTHPRWLKYNVTDYEILVNFEQTYSQKFGFLNNQKPVSVMLAEGSMITVENKTKLRQSNAP